MSTGLGSSAPIVCSKCRAPVPAASLTQGDFFPCGSCGSLLQILAFPALWTPPARGDRGERLLVSEEAGCFYHPDKKACVACDQCGRFLCRLCDLPLEGQHLCPHCLEVGKDKKTLQVLDTRRTLYGDMVLSLAILPLLMWPLTFLTAPATLILAFLRRHAPSGMVGVNQRVKMGLGILIALMEILGWGFGIFMVVNGT